MDRVRAVVIHKFIMEVTAALYPRRWERPYDSMSPYEGSAFTRAVDWAHANRLACGKPDLHPV